MSESSVEPILVMEGVAKYFGAVVALANGSIELFAGEAHALLGENGAGKSTLVKIIAGVYPADRGTYVFDGQVRHFHGPHDSQEAGIAVIYQEPTLFDDLNVAENIYLGRQPLGFGRRINRREMRKQSRAIFGQLGVDIDPNRKAKGLSVADQQMVEIAKALSKDARVVVMDEPTAALSPEEVRRLFTVVANLRQRGVAILFISHRLEEVYEICQRVTIMRDGSFVRTDLIGDIKIEEIVRSMVGRDLSTLFPKSAIEAGAEVLRVERLTREGTFYDISFSVNAGEIVALSGLVGSGRTEIARAIFGIDKYDAGSVFVNGAKLKKSSPLRAMHAGMGFVPEDRRQQGLVMDFGIDHNVALASLERLSHGLLLFRNAEQTLAADWALKLRLKYGKLTDEVNTLSGGNQQKVVLAKWLAGQPKLIIVDEPTRGIDVGTKSEVHRIIDDLAQSGVAVLMISSELPEILGMADRVLVMREGRLAATINRSDATQEKVMLAATGQV
ncbi:MAG TPA: sugar ABC transporter ATP-binding protein [Acidimicrobiales bacterium]